MAHTISVLCVGGPFDGVHNAPLNIDVGQLPEENQFAATAYFLSGQGTIGKRFWATSPHAMAVLHSEGIETAKKMKLNVPHKYEVASKSEEDGTILIELHYIAPDPK